LILPFKKNVIQVCFSVFDCPFPNVQTGASEVIASGAIVTIEADFQFL
jgi:hypothetical protein